MSAIAGRVLIIPKGAYNANEEYHMLDAVFFNGSTYIAKDTTTGNPPSDTEHWQVLAQGAQDAAASVFYGTCITAGSSQNKEVSVEVADNFALKRGAIVGVKFSNTNTFVASAANHITLNVNSSGVYSIYFDNTEDPEGTNPVAFGEVGFINYYQFDGVHWVYVSRSGLQTAEQTPYDNTSSGLTADNVNDAIDEVNENAEENISAIVNELSAKNLLKYPYVDTTKTSNGITFTDNGDGTVTINGTASTDTVFQLIATNSRPDTLALKVGEKYIISGCPSGGSGSSFFINVLKNYGGSWSSVTADVGSGAEFTYPENTYFVVEITIKGGTVISSSITFKPMIRDARISDPTYVPYAKTNRELTEFLKEGSAYIDLTAISQGAANGYITFHKIGAIKYLFASFNVRDIGNQPTYKPQSSIVVTNIPSGFEPIIGSAARGDIPTNNDNGVALNPAILELSSGKVILDIPGLIGATLYTYFIGSIAYI